jgi:uncharacterized damage-inducible protein DinB
VLPADVADLFGYLYWVRDRALANAAQLAGDQFLDPSTVAYRDLRATLVHELDVERSWRLRLQGAPTDAWDVTLEPGDYRDVAAVADAWQGEEAEALAWLDTLSDADLASPVTVNGLEGFPLAAYLTHIVMHGTESLSAAAILLHRAGRSMGDVGYLDYLDVDRPLPWPGGRRANTP